MRSNSSNGGVVGGAAGGIIRREPCKKCGLPVFLAERLNVNNYLYHRTCFRCARCSHQLSLANYYETEQGQYCCETCPDEVNEIIDHPINPRIEINPKIVLTKSLSDDEKGLNLDNLYSLEEQKLVTKARNHFLEAQLNQSMDHVDGVSDNESLEAEPPELPATKPPDLPDLDTLRAETPELINEIELDHTVESKPDLVEVESRPILPDLDSLRAKSLELEIKLDRDEKLETSFTVDDVSVPETDLCDDSDIVNIINKPPSDNLQPLDSNNTKLDSSPLNTEFVTKDNNVKNETTIVTSVDDVTIEKEETPIARSSPSPATELSDNKQIENKGIKIQDNEASDDEIEIQKGASDDEKENEIQKGASDDEKEMQKKASDDQKAVKIAASDDEKEAIKIGVCDDGIKIQTSSDSIASKASIAIKGDEIVESDESYPEDLNPFGDDDSDDKVKESTNPFGSDEDDEEEEKPVPVIVKEPATPRKLLKAPKVNLNPFLSDDDDELLSEDDDVRIVEAINATSTRRPVPKPRNLHPDNLRTPEPSPRKQYQTDKNGTIFGSATSLESSVSSKSTHTPTGTYRKKKPAPPPPTSKEVFSSSATSSPISRSINITTPTGTVRMRKNRQAPAPPTSTPTKSAIVNEENINEAQNDILIAQITSSSNNELEFEKISKDEKNRNRQSLASAVSARTIASSQSSDGGDTSSLTLPSPDKSTYGKWKRKKGPAPPRPLPQRRQINILSPEELKQQLDDIEIQQLGLEKQGVKLEQIIREKCEVPGADSESLASIEVEDMVLQLFELVNEKNELFRKQAELMYLRRQQRLEEEHADLEYQIRCLMDRPERNKTDYDKEREEELINRLIEVVERRNEIVECLEMDRLREAEEDESINTHLHLLAVKRDEDLNTTTSSIASTDSTKLSKKEKKKQKKIKKSKGVTMDVDKDVDETESCVKKDKKVKKWLFKI